MGFFGINVEVDFAGKPRNISHAAYINDGSFGNGQLTTENLITLGFGGLSDSDLEAVTDPSGVDYDPTGIIGHIIGFHRYWHHASSVIKGIYVHDFATELDPETIGLPKRLALSCEGVAVPVGFDEVESANNTLHIAKSIFVAGAEPGAMYLRGALAKEATVADGQDGVTIQAVNLPVIQTRLRTIMDLTTGGTAFRSFFYDSIDTVPDGGVAYAVVNMRPSPTHKTRRNNPKQVFWNGYVCNDLEVIDAADRNTRRRGPKQPVNAEGPI
jgi:hypothetical protein